MHHILDFHVLCIDGFSVVDLHGSMLQSRKGQNLAIAGVFNVEDALRTAARKVHSSGPISDVGQVVKLNSLQIDHVCQWQRVHLNMTRSLLSSKNDTDILGDMMLEIEKEGQGDNDRKAVDSALERSQVKYI